MWCPCPLAESTFFFIYFFFFKSDLDSNNSKSLLYLAYLGLQGSLSCFQFSHSFSDIHIRSSILLHLANKLPLKQTGDFKQAHRKPLTRLQQRFNPRLCMLSKQSAYFLLFYFSRSINLASSLNPTLLTDVCSSSSSSSSSSTLKRGKGRRHDCQLALAAKLASNGCPHSLTASQEAGQVSRLARRATMTVTWVWGNKTLSNSKQSDLVRISDDCEIVSVTCCLTASLKGARISSMLPSMVRPSASCSHKRCFFSLHKQTDVENGLFRGG